MSSETFKTCAPGFVKRAVLRTLAFRNLPPQAERDVEAALDRVAPESQSLLIQLAEDAQVPREIALERLACLWISAAAINLADDLADGDCDYLEPRVAPGVSYLLQALATFVAARSRVSLECLEAHANAMTLAAAGQSLEVRAQIWTAERYLEVARLIAGEQYAAHLRLLWHGTSCETRALAVGRAVGVVAIAITDIQSFDRRFTSMALEDKTDVLREVNGLLEAVIEPADMAGLRQFASLARSKFVRASPLLEL